MPSSLFSSYLASGMRRSQFFPSDFGDREARVARVRAAVRPVAAEVLAALSSPTRANLDKLAHGAAAVVTGQQVGLFLGPLYSLYKAATAVAAAAILEEEAGVPCAPVFWLQTEDHDFAEIASCPILPSRVLQLPLDDARVSVGCRRMPSDPGLGAALNECLSGQPHAAEVQTLFAASYHPGAPLADAFRQAMSRFFPELVFVEPRRLPSAPLFERAIERAAEIERTLAQRGDELRQAGFDEQVRPRPGYTLVFHHPEGPDGPRYRIETRSSHNETRSSYYETRSSYDETRSSSALLRPIVQDALLPTAAYVGGPGEINYLAQVTALHPLFELVPPMIVPRARFRLIPPAARRLLSQLAVTPTDAEDAQLLSHLAPPAPPGPDASWLAELEARLDAHADKRGAERARRSLHHTMARLERRHRTLALAKETTLAERVRRVQEWLFPGGVPQERVFGVPWFAAHAGIDSLREMILAAIDVLNPSVKDLPL
jgi:bacillithiol biosynthesis cysteine-adding enzyme BshC